MVREGGAREGEVGHKLYYKEKACEFNVQAGEFGEFDE